MKPQIPGRWHAQGLDAPRFSTGAEVVKHLGAVQSQLHDMSLWAIGRRCGRTLAELQTEFDQAGFVRTHVLRPTWHNVLIEDLCWLQSLTAHRVHRLGASQRRELGIDDRLLADALAATPTALESGPLTRAELAQSLADEGVDVAGPRMAYIAMHLEIECLVASGPLRDKQHTYRLLPPRPPEQSRDDLLAKVAIRYGRGHGAFRDRDLAWWTSLTLTDARRAIDLAGLPLSTIDGETYAVPPDVVEADPPRATLLSNFDEYISFARDPVDFAATASSPEDVLRGTGLLLIDGALAGRWGRTVHASTVEVNVVCDAAITGTLRQAIQREADAFGRFLDRDASLMFSH